MTIKDIFDKRNAGEISDSQAYKEYLNFGGDGTFKDFMTNAVNEGWIDRGLGALSGWATAKYGGATSNPASVVCGTGLQNDGLGNCIAPAPQGMSVGAKIGVGFGVLALIGGIIYIIKTKK